MNMMLKFQMAALSQPLNRPIPNGIPYSLINTPLGVAGVIAINTGAANKPHFTSVIL